MVTCKTELFLWMSVDCMCVRVCVCVCVRVRACVWYFGRFESVRIKKNESQEKFHPLWLSMIFKCVDQFIISFIYFTQDFNFRNSPIIKQN